MRDQGFKATVFVPVGHVRRERLGWWRRAIVELE